MEKIKFDFNIEETDEEIEKMYQEYLNCPAAIKEIKRLGIPDEKVRFYIVKIYDLVNDINHCSKCKDVKKCTKNNPLLCTKLTYENGVVDRSLVPCPKILESAKIQSKFIFKDFDDDLNNADLHKIDTSITKKVDIVKQYSLYKLNKSDKWIYIQSDAMVGKSYVAAAIANNFAKTEDGNIGFINAAYRFREMADYSFSDKELFEDMITSMCSCELLVIDGLGNEYKTDFVRDGILYRIISNRANKNLMTIITSDFSIDEIIELYSSTKAAQIRARQLGKMIKAKSVVFNLSTDLKGLYQ